MSNGERDRASTDSIIESALLAANRGSDALIDAQAAANALRLMALSDHLEEAERAGLAFVVHALQDELDEAVARIEAATADLRKLRGSAA